MSMQQQPEHALVPAFNDAAAGDGVHVHFQYRPACQHNRYWWPGTPSAEVQQEAERRMPVRPEIQSLALMLSPRFDRWSVRDTWLDPFVRMYPNLTELKVTNARAGSGAARFPQLTELNVRVGDAAGELLRKHGGQIQRLSLYDLNTEEETCDVPALAFSMRGSAAAAGALVPQRLELHVETDAASLREWATALSQSVTPAPVYRLHTLCIKTWYTGAEDEPLQWTDLEVVVRRLAATLNTLVVWESDGSIDKEVPNTLVRMLRGTNVTEFKATSRALGIGIQRKLSPHLPNLCTAEFTGFRKVGLHTEAVPDSLRRANVRRDGWGYVCVALACLRANCISAIKRSYVPLMPEIAACAGWGDTYGGLTFYARKQQNFCDRLYSLTSSASSAAAAAAAAVVAPHKRKRSD